MARKSVGFLYRIIMSFYAPIPAILAIQFGGGAKAVGTIAALKSLGDLISNYFWPRYAAEAKRPGVVALGFLGTIFGALLLRNSKTLIPAVVIMALLPPAAYYFLLEGVRRQKGKLSKNVSSFYLSESLGILLGMILGALSSYFLSATHLSTVLLGVTFIGMIISVSSMDKVNLDPLPTIATVEESFAEERKLKKFGLKYIGEFGLTKKMLPYLFMSGLFSFSFALVYPQLPVIVELVFGNATLFYTFAIFARIFGTLGFKVAGELGHKSIKIGWPIRLFAFLLVALSALNKWALPIFFLVAGVGWAFIKTFYGIRNLEGGNKLTSLNLTTRSLFYAIGSLLGGFILENYGFVSSALLSALIFFIAPMWLMASEKSLTDGGKNLKQERVANS